MASNAENNLLSVALSHDDKAVFNCLFEKLYPKIKFYITGVCHDETEAENLTQNLFMKLWIKREQLLNIENLDAYIFTIAHHDALNFLRHSLTLSVKPIDDSVRALQDGEDEERSIEYKELLQRVYDEIDKMPLQRRKVFLMSRDEGLSNQEIADRLGISKRTVETHISTALKELRRLAPLFFLLNSL